MKNSVVVALVDVAAAAGPVLDKLVDWYTNDFLGLDKVKVTEAFYQANPEAAALRDTLMVLKVAVNEKGN